MNAINKTVKTIPNTSIIEAQLFRVQDKYWKAQESLIKRRPAPVITRAELEDLAINGNVAAYLGNDYQPMNQFKRRLRLPAPPFSIRIAYNSRIYKASSWFPRKSWIRIRHSRKYSISKQRQSEWICLG